MVKSMTGFGKATGEINNKKITVDIKSRNSKQADISVRMPSFYKEKELALRSFINKNLQRGKMNLISMQNFWVKILIPSSTLIYLKNIIGTLFAIFQINSITFGDT